MSKNFYETLGVSKSSSKEEIKKAYRKLAMQHHPDRNKGDKNAEKKFKEISEAYEILSDDQKRKNYDTFGSSGFNGNPFGGGNQKYSYSTSGIDLEDLFANFGGNTRGGNYTSSGFDFGEKPISLDIEKIYEVPVFDLILGCKIEVRGYSGEIAKLKIPANTKSGTKFRVKDFGKTINGKKGNLIVIVDVRMPKNISDIDKKLLESIRGNIGY